MPPADAIDENIRRYDVGCRPAAASFERNDEETAMAEMYELSPTWLIAAFCRSLLRCRTAPALLRQRFAPGLFATPEAMGFHTG